MTTVTQHSRLIAVENGDYPVFLSNLSKYAPNTFFGPEVDSELLSTFGLEVVITTTPPEADVVDEGKPELRDGVWHQTWESRSFDETEMSSKLAEKKELLTAQAETLRSTAFTKGFPYKFPNGEVYHVQVRASDRGNISDLRTVAKEAIAAEQEMSFPFRVYENVSVSLTAPEFVAMADKTLQQVLAGFQVNWAYKDAIKDATTLEEIPTPPEEYFSL